MAAQRSELRSPSEADPDLGVMPSEDESDSPPSPPAPTWLLRSARHSAARGPSVARGTAQGRVHSASALNERGSRQLAAVAAAAAAEAAGPAAQCRSGRASPASSATASPSPRWRSAGVARGTAQGRVHSSPALNKRGSIPSAAAAAAAQAAGLAAQGWSGRASSCATTPRTITGSTCPPSAVRRLLRTLRPSLPVLIRVLCSALPPSLGRYLWQDYPSAHRQTRWPDEHQLGRQPRRILCALLCIPSPILAETERGKESHRGPGGQESARSWRATAHLWRNVWCRDV